MNKEYLLKKIDKAIQEIEKKNYYKDMCKATQILNCEYFIANYIMLKTMLLDMGCIEEIENVIKKYDDVCNKAIKITEKIYLMK